MLNLFGVIDVRVWSVFDLDNVVKYKIVIVIVEIIVMIVKDIVFFFILYIIDDVNIILVIDMCLFFDFFNVLKISDMEFLKNK